MAMRTRQQHTVMAGTSGWAYPSWKPGFYPAKLPAKRFLEHYGSRLNSVEVNYTFRALPTVEQLEGWMAAVAKSFRFSFKAPEAITHRRRLGECEDALEEFLESIEPVRRAGALGCILFQLPPNFKADHARLQGFLELPGMKKIKRAAFEFRHESWFMKETWALLRTHEVALCVAESESLQTPDVLTAKSFACYRLRMPGGYSPQQLAQHAEQFRALSARRDVYVYYKHEEEPTGALAAEAVLQQLLEAAAAAPECLPTG
ncbi:MAG: DUF72 domain-containing protein [Janthinobacterium lividum]